jgi:hypothetical protein
LTNDLPAGFALLFPYTGRAGARPDYPISSVLQHALQIGPVAA